jgi:pimeloyl-ACP methyl ester carboxylesterase
VHQQTVRSVLFGMQNRAFGPYLAAKHRILCVRRLPDLAATADAVAAAVVRLGLQGCCLVGYSLGARLGLELAAHRAELFSTVVSVSGTPGITGVP